MSKANSSFYISQNFPFDLKSYVSFLSTCRKRQGNERVALSSCSRCNFIPRFHPSVQSTPSNQRSALRPILSPRQYATASPFCHDRTGEWATFKSALL